MLDQLLIAAFVLFFIAETIRSERRRLYGTSVVTMEVDKVVFPGLTNGSRMYSPITMSREWPTLGRLALMVFASIFGATMNGYFVTSFLIDAELSRIENLYHCCLGTADMLITAGVIPIAAVVLLSGVWDINPVCQGLQALTTASTYCYSIFFALVAAENYFRVCHFTIVTDQNKKIAIAISAIIVFPFSIILAFFGTYWRLDYDYCERRYVGDILFRQVTFLAVHGTCFMFTIGALVTCFIHIRRENRLPAIYRRIHQMPGDIPNLIRLNFISYLLYIGSWLPYLVIVNVFPNWPDDWFYQSAWFGIGRSLITSMLYGSLGRLFARAFTNIFLYCCCKISFYNYPSRSRRAAMEYNAMRGGQAPEVRTHIMQQAVNTNSPQRASSSTRETLEL